ncbi:broad-minded protein-domain-containing protein [Fimicolochytrium jonesii]|uniref:broad-minded protein-domain-containing protein n=1 Tax=Fimicolochytrium jonesii TaxID=1396493 RepID=UPI0022FDBC24|nr:broad-minded protein-domain-containing protein [Fimicolochytrium jonesii]KAI8822140.1 broad-minded protein-domain-containing protein [Fimicolochytrium jonesii]
MLAGNNKMEREPGHRPSHAGGGQGSGGARAEDIRHKVQQDALGAKASAADFVKSWVAATIKIPRRRRLDALVGLERSDENFHRYAFVKYIEKQINSFVAPTIDAQLKSARISDGAPQLDVPMLVESLMNSEEYASFVRKLLDDASESISQLMAEGPTSLAPVSSDAFADEETRRQQEHRNELRKLTQDLSTQSLSTNESASWSLSLEGQTWKKLPYSSLPVLSIEEIRTIETNLQRRNSVEVRQGALQRLASYPSMDLLCGEVWPDAKSALKSAISDPDSRIATGCLRIYARIFRAAPTTMMGEIYLSLVDHLTHIFESGYQDKVVDGLCIEDVRVQLLLKKFRLLNQFQQELTSCWVRFSDQLIKEVMLATFRLFGLSSSIAGWADRMKSSLVTGTAPGKSSFITPLHYLSIVDVGAVWFERWTISKFGRSHIAAAVLETGVLNGLAARFMAHAAHLLRTSSSIAKNCDEVLVLDVEVAEDLDELVARRKIGIEDLEYVHFLHVLVVLGKLSIFEGGKECFPVDLMSALGVAAVPALQNVLGESLTNSKASTPQQACLTLEGLTQIFVRLMCQCPRTTFTMHMEDGANKGHTLEALKLSSFVVRLLREIIETDKLYDKRLLKSSVFAELMQPLHTALGSGSQKGSPNDLESLSDVAETLSNIAATDSGRQFILQQETAALVTVKSRNDSKGISNRPEQARVLQTVTSYVEQMIRVGITSQQEVKVLGGFIFFLRQLYRTCDGLRHLQQYNLHMTLARILNNGPWKDKNGELAVSMSKAWHSIAVDNLLNYAGTPKGVLLLQLSGSMNPAVAYMVRSFCFRYEKKMQVSKCDKFGYGVLVSQISTTKSGMQALYSAGLLKLFFSDMWGFLEHDDTVSIAAPLIEPLDDHLAKKLVGNILKVLISFPGLCAIVAEEDKPTTGRDSLDFLMKNALTDNKGSRRSDGTLGRYDELQLVALRILKIASSSLDSCILLQAHYRFQEALLSMQVNAQAKSGGRLPIDEPQVIDEASLLRNYILIATFAVGGAGERVLPPIKLCDVLQQPLPTVHAYPVPVEYMPPIAQVGTSMTPQLKTMEKDLEKLLSQPASQMASSAWLQNMESVVSNIITFEGDTVLLSARILSACRFLPEILRALINLPERDRNSIGWITLNAVKPDAKVKSHGPDNTSLLKYDSIGLDIAARYAHRHMRSIPTEKFRKDLASLLHETRTLLRPHQKQPSEARETAQELSSTFPGFDWFLSTAFILLQGDKQRTLTYLTSLLPYLPSMYMWPQRAHRSRLFDPQRYDVPLLYSTCCHLVEAILETELPALFSAFTLSGCTPSQLTQRWFRELFWTHLPLSSIGTYLLLATVFGIDYQIYFCIALLKHIQPAVLIATRDHGLVAFLGDPSRVVGASDGIPHISTAGKQKEGTHGKNSGDDDVFAPARYLSYMHTLRDKYRIAVLREMREAVGC